MSATVSDNDVPPERSTPGWHAHPEHSTVERYWDGQRWTEHRFASKFDDASPRPRPETSAASSLAVDRDPQERTVQASAVRPSHAQDETGSQTPVAQSVAAGQVRLGRTMGIAGLCAVVPLVGNSLATLLTGLAGRASWLVVPAVGVAVAMVIAGIEAYGSATRAQRPRKDDAQELQHFAQPRLARGKTSLAFALIVAVLVFGFGGFAVSEGMRYVSLEARAAIRDSEPGPSEPPSRATKSGATRSGATRSGATKSGATKSGATKPAPSAVAPPPAPARCATVPDVAGHTIMGATYELEDCGFKSRGDFEPNPTVQIGRVIRTDPPAGTKGRPGQSVTFYMSSTGPNWSP
jgi:hypothetical protein